MIVIGKNWLYAFLVFAAILIMIPLASSLGYMSAINESYNVSGRVIVLDPGHGGEDPGKISPTGLKEKDINLKIAQKVREKIEASGNKCILTREEDKLHYTEGNKKIGAKRREDLEYRRSIAEKTDADIFISIHLNSFPESRYYGAQVFYPGNSPESVKLAETLQNEFKDRVDKTNKRQALMNNDVRILINAKKPTVLAECGFLSNPEEEKNLKSEEYLDKIADAIFCGCMKYFNNQ